jgi:hypothetical protein
MTDRTPITLAHYVATFDGSTPAEQAAAAAEQLSSTAQHFGTQAGAFIRGIEANTALGFSTSPEAAERLCGFASDAARVAWRFASDAETVWTWHNGGAE